jgi:hypothetical protein
MGKVAAGGHSQRDQGRTGTTVAVRATTIRAMKVRASPSFWSPLAVRLPGVFTNKVAFIWIGDFQYELIELRPSPAFYR